MGCSCNFWNQSIACSNPKTEHLVPVMISQASDESLPNLVKKAHGPVIFVLLMGSTIQQGLGLMSSFLGIGFTSPKQISAGDYLPN